ncbi:ferric reductase like transmembrane component-domain-containing protein [Butyriboletus roseoflavus]|nr:ferric reductase like transmembrane component-domain-containing protein [Butyriboletus roseoflavus]
MAVDPFSLVFHIDIFLVAIATVFALSTLPRVAARYSSAAEWRRGHLLRSISLGVAHLRAAKTHISYPRLQDPNEKHLSPQGAGYSSSLGHDHVQDGVMTEESYTYVSHTHLLRQASTRTLGSVSNLPPHFSSWSAILPPVGGFLRRRLKPGFSVGQALVLGLYAVILIYASFLESNPFKDPLRMGIVAMSQIPIVFALGTKNNIIGMCIGLGYEKLNYIHRYAGMMLVLLSNIHACGYIYRWTFAGQFTKNMQVPANRMGVVALVALDVLFFFSTSFWRRKAYNIFFFSHIACFAVFLPMVHAHEGSTLQYIIAAVAAYGLDRVLRILKTRILYARIRPIPDLSVTRLEIPALNAGWRAGQHVRIRVLSSAMGLIGWAETHPFTIASVAKTPDGLVLLCKNAGGWTKRLYEMAKVAGYGCEDGDATRMVAVMLDGPYGGPGHSVFASFSAAMFVVGGSGITFALSAIQDLIQRDSEDSSRVKVIELIWSIQDPSALNPLVPLFSSLIQQSTRTPLRISVHYTRAADVLPAKNCLPPGLTLTAGRPRIAKVLDSVIARAVSYGSSVKAYMDITGVVVGVCGPVGIGDEVSQAVSAVDPGRRWAVGGIEIHEETFGW